MISLGLPLFSSIHSQNFIQAGSSSCLLRDWLDVVSTRRGLPLARLRLHRRLPLVDKMLDDWIEPYHHLDRLLSPFGASSLAAAATAASTIVDLPETSCPDDPTGIFSKSPSNSAPQAPSDNPAFGIP